VVTLAQLAALAEADESLQVVRQIIDRIHRRWSCNMNLYTHNCQHFSHFVRDMLKKVRHIIAKLCQCSGVALTFFMSVVLAPSVLGSRKKCATSRRRMWGRSLSPGNKHSEASTHARHTRSRPYRIVPHQSPPRRPLLSYLFFHGYCLFPHDFMCSTHLLQNAPLETIHYDLACSSHL
jgi:hypothetical protein